MLWPSKVWCEMDLAAKILVHWYELLNTNNCLRLQNYNLILWIKSVWLSNRRISLSVYQPVPLEVWGSWEDQKTRSCIQYVMDKNAMKWWYKSQMSTHILFTCWMSFAFKMKYKYMKITMRYWTIRISIINF